MIASTACILLVKTLEQRGDLLEDKPAALPLLPVLLHPLLPPTRSVLPSVWTLVRLRASCSSSRSDTSSSSSGVWGKEQRVTLCGEQRVTLRGERSRGSLHVPWEPGCSFQHMGLALRPALTNTNQPRSSPHSALGLNCWTPLLAATRNLYMTRMDCEFVTYRFY